MKAKKIVGKIIFGGLAASMFIGGVAVEKCEKCEVEYHLPHFNYENQITGSPMKIIVRSGGYTSFVEKGAYISGIEKY